MLVECVFIRMSCRVGWFSLIEGKGMSDISGCPFGSLPENLFESAFSFTFGGEGLFGQGGQVGGVDGGMSASIVNNLSVLDVLVEEGSRSDSL